MPYGETCDVIYTCCAGCDTTYTHRSYLDVGDREYCRKCIEAERKDLGDDEWMPHPHIPGWWVRRGLKLIESIIPTK